MEGLQTKRCIEMKYVLKKNMDVDLETKGWTCRFSVWETQTGLEIKDLYMNIKNRPVSDRKVGS